MKNEKEKKAKSRRRQRHLHFLGSFWFWTFWNKHFVVIRDNVVVWILMNARLHCTFLNKCHLFNVASTNFLDRGNEVYNSRMTVWEAFTNRAVESFKWIVGSVDDNIAILDVMDVPNLRKWIIGSVRVIDLDTFGS
jgi:hypothetical protein